MPKNPTNIIFFSHNAHKLREVGEILGERFALRGFSEVVAPFEVAENGASFKENAILKLEALREKIAKTLGESGVQDCILMSEDSGICVEALGGYPGIFSSRWANLSGAFGESFGESARESFAPRPESQNPRESANPKSPANPAPCDNLAAKNAPDCDNLERLICDLKNLGREDSNASFVSCLAAWKNGRILAAHGFLHGRVVAQKSGENGFGYDPIFVPNGFATTLANLAPSEKNAISHRRAALDLMRLLLWDS